ncbi:MAG: GntR family transcriptional regulator, partial [Solirubrobacterales bacterium]|nr:GntR family transcriptional regulator [Solirubrobacterales bacterium]
LATALAERPALAVSGAVAGELAEHWLAAGRPVEALTASLRAARQAEAIAGLSEALRHVERVLDLWEQVPHAEEVAGLAMPALLAWTAELAGAVGAGADAMDARRLAGVLGTLRPVEPAVTEARELYPLAVVLESIAIRQSPRFDPTALEALRRINERLRAARHDVAAAIVADDDFHRELTARCGNEPLLAALRPVKEALLRYEDVYMGDPSRVERSAAQHDAIIGALERGDQPEAAHRLRGNLTGGLPDLVHALER